jgi:CHAT domain-containing protein
LLKENIDTLIVVPIFTVGAVPFAALPLEGQLLVERMSVVVAPGFFVFQERPPETRRQWPHAVVAGDPEATDPGFRPLEGARQEAREVARLFGVTPLIGPAATAAAVRRAVEERPDASVVYLATHGVADGDNPRDDSFLLMSDRRWTARQVGELHLTNRPLVVLSACQTGLGRNFDVGTIGMARAWQQIGASQVVMSLWNVNDAVTSSLMEAFVRGIKAGQPVDKALRQAMRATRASGAEDPAFWAGFTVFGVPTR